MTELPRSDDVVPPEQLLPQLADAILRLGIQLDINAPRQQRRGRDAIPSWVRLIRHLYLVDKLSGPRSVVVTGEQGAGKTRLMRNLYPEARDWLEDNAARGEKNAVQIVERNDCTRPRGRVTYRLPGPDALKSRQLTRTVDFDAAHRTEWQRLVRGEDPAVLLCALEVPPVFWGIDGTGFVLLPGLERGAEQHWQSLMKIVLATSPAAILVADERRMANAAQLELLKHMRSGGDDMKFVVAISRCEASPPDVITTRIDRAVEVFGIDAEDVVAIGKDVSSPEDWPNKLFARVDLIRSSAADRRQLETDALRTIVDDDLLMVLDAAHEVQVNQHLDTERLELAERFLELYDNECEQVRSTLQNQLTTNFGAHMGAASRRLDSALKETGGWKEPRKRFGEVLRLQWNEHHRRLAALVEEAWWGPGPRVPSRPDGPLHAHRATVQGVADARWAVVSQQFASSRAPDERFDKDVSRALSGRPPATVQGPRETAELLRERSIDEVIKALPAVALHARAFAIELARPDGTIEGVCENDMRSFVGRLGTDRQHILQALGLLLGGDLLVDGDLDTPANLVNLAQIIFTGGTEAAGTAGAAGAAAAAQSALLAGIGVAVIAAVLVKAGNDAARERDNLARRHLQEYLTTAEQGIRDNVEELLAVVREMLQARLYTALGVNRGLNAQFSLLAASQHMENVRARMLEAIGHAEFG